MRRLWPCQKRPRQEVLAGGMGCKHLIASLDRLRISDMGFEPSPQC